MNHRHTHHGRCGLMVLVLLTLAFVGQAAIGASNQPAYVPNQLIVRTTPGLSGADLTKALDTMGAKLVRPISLANTYLVELLPTRGATVESAVTRASAVPGIAEAAPNHYRYPTAIPNDTLWSSLWGMRMIHMPQAWDVEKGKATVVVAVNDTGVSLTHPDLQGRLLPGRDVADNDNDPSPSPTDLIFGSHGTHVAGIIAAQGNNAQGVVGVCWDGVKILPVKIYSDAGVDASPVSAIVDGLDWAMTHGAQIVNMSYGGYDINVFERDKLAELAAAGIILVAAAGNDNISALGYPASYPDVVAVSALGPTEAKASYSNFGPEIDIAAPGGDPNVDDGPGTIWSTDWSALEGNTYHGGVGTSYATPHVSGACALLLSHGVPAASVVSRLYKAARAPAIGTLDPFVYGHGVMDVYAALVTPAEIHIVSPTSGQSMDTGSPTIVITTSLVEKSSIKVYLDFPDADKDGYPDDPTSNIIVDSSNIDSDPAISYDASTGTLTIRWPIAGQSPLAAGVHSIAVTGDPSPGAVAISPKDSCIFFVQPHVITAGRHLISVPYPLPATTTPCDLFGVNSSLARWIPATSEYATINYPGDVPCQVNALAWPTTPLGGVRPRGSPIDTPPAGLGFWLDTPTDVPVAVGTSADKTIPYEIVLTRGTSGWNMIGDPFPFSVPWDSVELTYQGRTLGLAGAVAAGWIRPALYSYTSAGYIFKNAPDAVLVPWEGNWIRILPNDSDKPLATMVLTVPPLDAGRATRGRATTTTSNELSIRLAASVGTASDSYNIAGVNSRAVDGYDTLDVDEPPVGTGYVQLSFSHKDWGANSGRYATDVRTSVGTGKTWDFDVTTDLPNKDVVVTWPDVSSVPKKYAVTIEDLDNGAKVYARTRSAYTFNSGSKPGARRFRLSINSADAGPMILTNVTASMTRGSTVGISYTVSREAKVEVRLRNSLNQPIRTLGGSSTRAAGINSVHWDATNDAGIRVPGGVYLIEIIATSPDGEVAKVMKPVLVP